MTENTGLAVLAFVGLFIVATREYGKYVYVMLSCLNQEQTIVLFPSFISV